MVNLPPPAASLITDTPPWSDAEGWNQPQYFSTLRLADVNQDGKAELFARASWGIDPWLFNVATGQWETLGSSGPDWSDAGWSQPQYYLTILAADIDGDGEAEVLGRSASGMCTWKFSQPTGQWQQLADAGCGWTDVNHWDQASHYATIQAADVDGDGQAELLGRGPSGMEVWHWNATGKAWVPTSTGVPEWSDAGWDQPQYYATIRTADLDGDGQHELLGRDPNGMQVWKFDTGTNAWQQLADAGCGWTDVNHWDQAPHYTTIQAADVNGDGQAELLGRSAAGIEVWSFDSAETQWQQLASGGCNWTDTAGWNQPASYLTLRLADINGDQRAELLGRSATGLETWSFATGQWTQLSSAACGWTDVNHWDQAAYYSTICLADIDADGRAELLARAANGVETWVFNSAIGQWQQPVPKLRVDARFMENYIQGTTVTAANVVATTNGDGEVEFFAVGSDGQVYEYYPDPSSDTGWSQAPVGMSSPTGALAAGLMPDGSLVVFAGQAAGNEWHSGVLWAKQNPAGSTSRWQAAVKLPAAQDAECSQLLAQNFGGDDLFLGAVFNGPDRFVDQGYHWGAEHGLGTNWTGVPAEGLHTCLLLSVDNGIGYVDFCNGKQWNTILQQHLSTGGETAASGAAAPSGPPAAVESSSPTPLSLAATSGAVGNAVYYAILSDGNLYSGSRAGSPETPPIAWTTQLTKQGKGTQNIKLASVIAWVDAAGASQILVTGQNGTIYRYDPAGSPKPLVDLGVQGMVAGAQNASGDQILFVAARGSSTTGVSPTSGAGVVSSLWQDAESGDWQLAAIEIVPSDTVPVQPIVSYTTEITVLDTLGQPRPNAPVSIWSDSSSLLAINGSTVWVGARQAFQTRTNAAGQVTVLAQADSLATPLLKVWTDAMPGGDAVVIEPNLEVQARLRQVDDQQLLQPKDFFGDPLAASLLPGKHHTDETAKSVAQSITACMTLVAPTTGTSGGANRSLVRHLSQTDQRFSSKIDLTAVPEQHWRLDFSSGTPRFTWLAADEARAHIEHIAAELEKGTVLGIAWGDAWRAVRAGVGTIASQVISVTSGAISATISFVIDGVTYWFDGLLTLIEQAFDVIEGLFETMGTAFQQLFEWLAFIFNWTDIQNTQVAIRYMAEQTFTVLTNVLQYANTQINSAFTQYQHQLDDFFDQMINSDLGAKNLLAMQETMGPIPQRTQFSMGNNVMATAILNSTADSGPPSATFALPADDSIQTLIQQLTSISQQFAAAPAFSAAIDSFSELADQLTTDPDAALRALTRGVLQVMQGLATTALQLTQLLVNAIMTALGAVIQAVYAGLTAPWTTFPFVSALYSKVTGGGTLCALDLGCLILAIPVTVFYKVTSGQAPFPTAEDVTAFTSAWSGQTISQFMTGAGRAADELADSLSTTLLLFFFRVNQIATILFGIGSAFCDGLFPPVNPPAMKWPLTSLIYVTLVFELMVWISSLPVWSVSPVRPIGAKWLTWLPSWITLLGLGADIAWGIAGIQIAELNGDYGVGTTLIIATLMIGTGVILCRSTTVTVTPLQMIGYFAGQLPEAFKFLRLTGIFKKTKGLSIAALCLLDVGGYIVMAAANYHENLFSNGMEEYWNEGE